ncbi:MAG: hypothetical protein U5R31_07560 [Acidimicrobiia bacterium]|nr:hypothetical protein [Acidimicrobiia bacterium]
MDPAERSVVDDGLDALAGVGVNGSDETEGGVGFAAADVDASDREDDSSVGLRAAGGDGDEVVAPDGPVVADVFLGVGVAGGRCWSAGTWAGRRCRRLMVRSGAGRVRDPRPWGSRSPTVWATRTEWRVKAPRRTSRWSSSVRWSRTWR